MKEKYPSVRNLPISEKRRKKVISDLIEEFQNTAIGRKMINLKFIDSTHKLLRLGMNLIIERIWFVDYKGETSYSVMGLGSMQGKDLALKETELIINEIMGSTTEKNLISSNSSLNEEYLNKGISSLISKGFACTSILTNVHEVMNFWYFKGFEGVTRRLDAPFGFEGTYKGIPVYWTNSMPENRTLILNRNVGELLIGKKMSANVLEIKPEEMDSVIKNIPTLSRDDLEEKVRLVADEFIKFNMQKQNAFWVIKTKKSSENDTLIV
jgi:hypothetical protein